MTAAELGCLPGGISNFSKQGRQKGGRLGAKGGLDENL